jgi:hypothetical protein
MYWHGSYVDIVNASGQEWEINMKYCYKLLWNAVSVQHDMLQSVIVCDIVTCTKWPCVVAPSKLP